MRYARLMSPNEGESGLELHVSGAHFFHPAQRLARGQKCPAVVDCVSATPCIRVSNKFFPLCDSHHFSHRISSTQKLNQPSIVHRDRWSSAIFPPTAQCHADTRLVAWRRRTLGRPLQLARRSRTAFHAGNEPSTGIGGNPMAQGLDCKLDGA